MALGNMYDTIWCSCNTMEQNKKVIKMHKMEIETYYGTVTESKAQYIVRDLSLNQHEGDDGVYDYEPSSKYPGLFCIVKYTSEESYPLPQKW